MQISDLGYYLKNIFRLGIPILIGNISQMLINLGDIYVAGHYNTNTLAAISVSSAIFMTYIVAGFGVIGGIVPVLSNYRGEKIPTKKFLFPTIYFSLFVSVLFFVLIWLLMPFIYKFGLNDLILNDCIDYLKISSFSIFGIFLFSALKEYLQAHEIVKFPNILIAISVFANIILNIVLTYGYGIIPELGTKGLAYASLIVRILSGLILFLFCLKFTIKKNDVNIIKYVKDLLKVGIPIAIAMFLEFFGFNIVAILTGKLEPVYAACHNIIISITSIVYMIPFSIATALAVKVGYANGKKDFIEIKNYISSSMIFIFIYSSIIIAGFLLFKKQLMSIFTSDVNVINIGVSIMLLVACFNIFDCIQCICIGALKGMKQTLMVTIIDFVGYILISTPLGLYFAYALNMSLFGFWLGLTFGIFMAAIISTILFIRVFNIEKKKIDTLVGM